ncbi:MAG: hypothetical protein L0H55_16850, partial [Candidatus Nitrosocosmicus sp.]|nr:hypothetical protein [Candidatus Nitrosocosmicus sp.]
MTRCYKCHKSLNSSYIRVGANESFKKIGLYCVACDIYYSPNLSKQYTVLQKEYTDLTPNYQTSGIKNITTTGIIPSNNFNKDNKNIQ